MTVRFEPGIPTDTYVLHGLKGTDQNFEAKDFTLSFAKVNGLPYPPSFT